MISVDQLIACGVGAVPAAKFAGALSAAMDRFEINTPPRIAAFLGQVMVESQSLTRTEENLFYSHADRIALVFPRECPNETVAAAYVGDPQALGSHVYADRMGNGNEQSGDGYRYRGRGLLQITGRLGYAAASGLLGVDYVSNPDLVAQPADACLTAGMYWDAHELNERADAGDIDGITRAVNGSAMREAELRRHYTAVALTVFSA